MTTLTTPEFVYALRCAKTDNAPTFRGRRVENAIYAFTSQAAYDAFQDRLWSEFGGNRFQGDNLIPITHQDVQHYLATLRITYTGDLLGDTFRVHPGIPEAEDWIQAENEYREQMGEPSVFDTYHNADQIRAAFAARTAAPVAVGV